MKHLENKVAVITGAAEGIGKAIAVRAAAEGMKLVLADINNNALSATVSELRANGADVIGTCIDVANSSDVDGLARDTFARYGSVHLLVNNAGVALAKPVWETTVDDWSWIMGVNLYGVTNSLRAFIPAMIKIGEEGHIVNTASMAGMLSQPSLAAYSASKHAVVTISEGLHHDLMQRKSKIKVSVLCPMWVKTQISQAERNRITNSNEANTELDPVTSKVEAFIAKAVENGISPGEAADAVFKAIAEERFYVFTDMTVLPNIQRRMEAILTQSAPTM